MTGWIKNAIEAVIAHHDRDDIARTAEQQARSKNIAQAGRRLIDTNCPNKLAEWWIETHPMHLDS